MEAWWINEIAVYNYIYSNICIRAVWACSTIQEQLVSAFMTFEKIPHFFHSFTKMYCKTQLLVWDTVRVCEWWVIGSGCSPSVWALPKAGSLRFCSSLGPASPIPRAPMGAVTRMARTATVSTFMPYFSRTGSPLLRAMSNAVDPIAAWTESVTYCK